MLWLWGPTRSPLSGKTVTITGFTTGITCGPYVPALRIGRSIRRNRFPLHVIDNYIDDSSRHRFRLSASQKSGVVEQRLIYYADLEDLRIILEKNWSGEFSDAFGEWDRMNVFLTELKNLRDPDAHRRELMPHQKYLVLGIAGDIRTRLVRYRSKQETSEDYYPRIESVGDSLGNIYTYGAANAIATGARLRVGDVIEFLITATDPLGEPLLYGSNYFRDVWQESNFISLTLTEKDVRKQFYIILFVKSKREYHAKRNYDDEAMFIYEVLPSK
jgi:hypothetical protein